MNKEEIFGPFNKLKRAVLDNHNIELAAKDYVKALDTDVYDNKGRFSDLDDKSIEILFNIIDPAILADELQCSMYQLYTRAAQLGVTDEKSPLDEYHVSAVKSLFAKGATDMQIRNILGLPQKECYSSEMTNKHIKEAVIGFEKQGRLL